MADEAKRWDEMERRLLALEERTMELADRTMELAQRVATHDAVCVERQKMTFNTLSSIETQVTRLGDRMDTMAVSIDARLTAVSNATSRRLDGWLTAIAGTGVLGIGSLVMLILTRGLK